MKTVVNKQIVRIEIVFFMDPEVGITVMVD
jgi:hypothetical protein